MLERLAIKDLNSGDLIKFDNADQIFMWIGINGIAAGIHDNNIKEFAVDIIRPDLPNSVCRIKKGSITLNREDTEYD